MPPPDEANSVEFQYSDLRLDSKIDHRDLVELIHTKVTGDMGLSQSCVWGVHFLPNENWPQRVKIYCNDSNTRDTFLQRGLNILGGHIKLFEPGQGVKKVEIKNVPGDMPSYLITDVLDNFGTIVQFRQEKYKLRSGKQLDWTTGHRLAWMRDIESLPPVIKVFFNNKEIMLNVWHYGQTDKFCRHCKDIVAKDHVCPNAPVKKCFDCGSPGHLKPDCPVGKSCFKCGEKGHISSECSNTSGKKSERKLTLGSFINNGATGNSADLKPRTEPTEKRKSPEAPNLGSEDDFPKMSKGEVTRINGKKGRVDPEMTSEKENETVSSAKESSKAKVSGGKKTKARRKRARQRTGYISPLITNYLKVYDENEIGSCYETETGSCYETDEEYTAEESQDEEAVEKDTQESTAVEPEVKVVVTDTENKATPVERNEAEVDTNDASEDVIPTEGAEDMEVDGMAKSQMKVVAFGGSNCTHLDDYLKGDDEIAIKPRLLYEGGLKVAGVTQKIDEVGDEDAKKEVQYIALHVGSANFPYSEHEDQELMVGQYLSQLYELDRNFPLAEIVVCSIPLRIQHYPSSVQKQINS